MVNKLELQKLIDEGKTLKDIALELRTSYTNVRYWIKKMELRFDRKRGVRTTNTLSFNKRSVEGQRKRAIRRKLEFVNRLGGCCCKCGYNRNWSALEFHHINPEQKTIAMDLTSLGHYSTATLEEEIEKCKLLCANCHREEHNPDKYLVEPVGVEPT